MSFLTPRKSGGSYAYVGHCDSCSFVRFRFEANSLDSPLTLGRSSGLKISRRDIFLTSLTLLGFESLIWIFLYKKITAHKQFSKNKNGGEGGIRTLETLLTPTRFPIVRARPGYATSPQMICASDIIHQELRFVKDYFLRYAENFQHTFSSEVLFCSFR